MQFHKIEGPDPRYECTIGPFLFEIRVYDERVTVVGVYADEVVQYETGTLGGAVRWCQAYAILTTQKLRRELDKEATVEGEVI